MMGTPARDRGKEDAVAIALKNRVIAMKRHLEMAPEHSPLDTSASIRFAWQVLGIAPARSYFAKSTQAWSCPPGQERVGVRLF
jgi:hypothetical protein